MPWEHLEIDCDDPTRSSSLVRRPWDMFVADRGKGERVENGGDEPTRSSPSSRSSAWRAWAIASHAASLALGALGAVAVAHFVRATTDPARAAPTRLPAACLLEALRGAIGACDADPLARADAVIGHRGAALVAPEETFASFDVAAASGAGAIECDASLTRELGFVCRHATCDLASTTDIVSSRHADLHARCATPFAPGSGVAAVCCTFQFDLAELARLCARMDAVVNTSAATLDGYALGPPAFRSRAIEAATPCARLVELDTYLDHLAAAGVAARHRAAR